MFFGLSTAKPWSFTHIPRGRNVFFFFFLGSSISFSVMQRSYELFTILISPYISDPGGA